MTVNQIAYWSLVETKRSNLAREQETHRSNIANETETNRSNLVREKETERHNRATEGAAWAQAAAAQQSAQAHLISANASMLNAQTQAEYAEKNYLLERSNSHYRNNLLLSQADLADAQIEESKARVPQIKTQTALTGVQILNTQANTLKTYKDIDQLNSQINLNQQKTRLTEKEADWYEVKVLLDLANSGVQGFVGVKNAGSNAINAQANLNRSLFS